MKEYHIYKTPLPDGAEQVTITSAVRDEENCTITVEEIFIVTCIGGQEVKTRIDVTGLIKKIVSRPGGNVPIENYDDMYELLDPITPEDVQLQNQVDLYQHMFEPSVNPVDDLIFAAEMAASCHQTDFDSIVEELLDANITRK